MLKGNPNRQRQPENKADFSDFSPSYGALHPNVTVDTTKKPRHLFKGHDVKGFPFVNGETGDRERIPMRLMDRDGKLSDPDEWSAVGLTRVRVRDFENPDGYRIDYNYVLRNNRDMGITITQVPRQWQERVGQHELQSRWSGVGNAAGHMTIELPQQPSAQERVSNDEGDI